MCIYKINFFHKICANVIDRGDEDNKTKAIFRIFKSSFVLSNNERLWIVSHLYFIMQNMTKWCEWI